MQQTQIFSSEELQEASTNGVSSSMIGNNSHAASSNESSTGQLSSDWGRLPDNLDTVDVEYRVENGITEKQIELQPSEASLEFETTAAAAQSLIDENQRLHDAQKQKTEESRSDSDTIQAPTSLPVTELVITLSPALLFFKLLALGGFLLLLMIVFGLTIDLLKFVFGPTSFPILDNKMFTFTVGILLYMAIGFVFYQQWSHTRYTINPVKLMMEHGWIIRSRQTRDIMQFGGVQVRQNLIGKILKYGDLRLDYHGAIGKVAGETLHDIPDPFKVEQLLSTMIRTA